MPGPLPHACTKVKWRVRSDDLALLELLYSEAPGGVNAAVRELLHAVCVRLRERNGLT